MDLQALKDILPLLRDCRVEKLKLGELELVFKSDASETPKPIYTESVEKTPGAPPKPIETEKIADSVVPQSLEDEMDFDKILNWSSPDSNEGSVPLTNDAPLSDAPPAEVNSVA